MVECPKTPECDKLLKAQSQKFTIDEFWEMMTDHKLRVTAYGEWGWDPVGRELLACRLFKLSYAKIYEERRSLEKYQRSLNEDK